MLSNLLNLDIDCMLSFNEIGFQNQRFFFRAGDNGLNIADLVCHNGFAGRGNMVGERGTAFHLAQGAKLLDVSCLNQVDWYGSLAWFRTNFDEGRFPQS